MMEEQFAEDNEAFDDVSERDVAVIGMSGCFPGARHLGELWDLLAAGREAIEPLSDEALIAAGVPRSVFEREGYIKMASAIEGAEEFDAEFFGYNARDAAVLDPQQRLFLEHAWTTLENAGYTPAGFDGLIGVYAGVAWNTYLLSNLINHRELFDGAGAFQVFITNDKDFMPTRVSYKLDLKGPSVIIQTSCSTSLVATHLACLGLLSYECDMALVGGVTVKVPGRAGYFYQEGGLASPDGHCRTFDAKAAGTIFGSGIGVVALKRLADAIADGDRIRAVIKGTAINNDGSAKVSYTAPSVEGQAEVIAAAQEMAGVEPETIRYIECHGTATSLGDPIEVRALTKVFREAAEAKGFCALGSIKSNFGHLDAAAGIAGLIKTVLALEHGKIPPTLHFESPNPAIDFSTSPFHVAQELADWEKNNDIPRRAGVSSFGVGGTNAHAILEEAPPRAPSGPSRPWQLLMLSARTDSALASTAEQLRDHLAEAQVGEREPLADVAFTLRRGRTTFRCRRVAVVRDHAEAVSALGGEMPPHVWSATDRDEPRDRPIAFLFSGQGSQYPGMGEGLYENEAVFRDAVDHCAEILQPVLGEDLRQIIWPADSAAPESAAKLGQTRLTQPALFVLEYALTQLWESWGIHPQAMLGHSIGEYVAACVAKTLALEDALRLVAERGRLMGELPSGAMLAVPLSEDELAAELTADPRLSVAAVNEPSRVVVSGIVEAIDALNEALGVRGVEGRRLHTSHAFHSPMMEPILEAFTQEVGRYRLSKPEVPWVSNVTGTWITEEEATDPGYWARHLRQGVRFADGVATLLTEEERVFLEVGPGRALATLASRHPERRPEQAVLSSLRHPQDSDEGIGEDQAQMLAAWGRLWLAGVEMDEAALDTGEERQRVSLPTYPFERQRFWIDAGEPAEVEHRGLRQQPKIEDWYYLPAWQPALPPAAEAAAEPSTWLILERSKKLSKAVAAQLSGASVFSIEPGLAGSGLQRRENGAYTVDPADNAAWEALGREIGGPLKVVHAWAYGDLDEPQVETVADLRKVDPALLALLSLARLLSHAGSPTDLLVLGSGMKRLLPGEPLRPERAMLLGLCRVMPEEVPGLRCRVVDAQSESDVELLATRVIGEAAAGDEEVVAWRGHQRYIESFAPVRLADTPVVLRQQGIYALTGGLQGNGYAFARFLAREYKARLALLVDTDIAPARLQTLKDLGGDVETFNADLGDVGSVGEALEKVESHFGSPHGILHAASTDGEGTFRSLTEVDENHLAAHFGKKVHTVLALDAALGERGWEPDFCIALSSLATVLGGLAYGTYAAANSFLDAFAAVTAERHGAIQWRSLGWDVWAFEDEDEQITGLRADLADLAMTPGQGEEALRRFLGAGAEHMLVSTADLGQRRAERQKRIAAHAEPAPMAGTGERHPRPELQVPYAAPESDLEQSIAEVWQDFLGFDQVGLDDNFFELGGDSFIAVRVAARLREVLDVDLPVAQLYQRLTVRSLAELLAQDDTEAEAERAAHLAERRESMDRRQERLKRRRARRKTSDDNN